MVYVRRDEERGIFAIESLDGGLRWDEASRVTLYEQSRPAATTENLFDAMSQWSYGHPTGVKVGQRVIAVVYYAGEGKNTSLRFCKIEV
jgi:hypothetical protein